MIILRIIRNSQESFIALFKLLSRYLDEGEYCELYTCWTGEEDEDRNVDLDQTKS
jgi:hypothetical protein